VHFTRSEKSQAAGREFLKRFRLRAENRDPEVNEKVAPAQIEAISKWGAPREKPFEYLKSIRQPALVVNGGKDVIIYSVNSFILQQHLPNAQFILYPNANHGSQYRNNRQRLLLRPFGFHPVFLGRSRGSRSSLHSRKNLL
jgi:pimeloyl-ACP methyl ester carboxylesterase